jgi:hypothetical protein
MAGAFNTAYGAQHGAVDVRAPRPGGRAPPDGAQHAQRVFQQPRRVPAVPPAAEPQLAARDVADAADKVEDDAVAGAVVEGVHGEVAGLWGGGKFAVGSWRGFGTRGRLCPQSRRARGACSHASRAPARLVSRLPPSHAAPASCAALMRPSPRE